METPPFQGVIGDDWRDSTPWWPEGPTPPAGAPNVVLVVLDDVGFAQLGCYGSDIATPTIDGLAADGLRLTNFHTTALCSPTRACLLTGRSHHRNGLGRVADLAVGFPGLQRRGAQGERLPVRDPPAARVRHLRRGQVAPDPGRRDVHGRAPPQLAPGPGLRPVVRLPRRRDPSVRAGAVPRQPLGGPAPLGRRGLSPECRPGRPGHRPAGRPASRRRRTALLPVLLHRRLPLAPPRAPGVDRPLPGPLRPGVGRLAASRPSPVSSTWGSSPPAPRWRRVPAWVPAWDDLGVDEQRVAARFMECFAAFLSYTDAQLARLLEFLERTGDRQDTLVILVSDNGASSEGGPTGSINDNRLQNFDPAGTERAGPTHRRAGRPPGPQQLPVGLDHGRQHTVQAVEA